MKKSFITSGQVVQTKETHISYIDNNQLLKSIIIILTHIRTDKRTSYFTTYVDNKTYI